MKCIYCGFMDSKVLDSRRMDDGGVIRRRRECEKCGRRFTTYEKAERTILVVKKDGRRESFDSDKIRGGIIKSCEKRPVSASQIDTIIHEIEQTVFDSLEKEVTSEFIGELVMDKLQGIDEVAFVRFASVYRHFADVQAYLDILAGMKANRKG